MLVEKDFAGSWFRAPFANRSKRTIRPFSIVAVLACAKHPSHRPLFGGSAGLSRLPSGAARLEDSEYGGLDRPAEPPEWPGTEECQIDAGGSIQRSESGSLLPSGEEQRMWRSDRAERTLTEN